MRTHGPLASLTLALALGALACSSPPTPSDAASDANPTADAASDAASDALADTPAPQDASFPACNVPAVRVAGTAQTDALADAPARCGQSPHRWLRDASLGAVTTVGARRPFTRTTLEALAAGAGLQPPVPLVHNVSVDHIAYTTQDRGRTVEASALVAYPTGLRQGTEFGVLLFLHGTSGFTDGCGPAVGTETAPLLGLLASAGYIVVAPDYIGLSTLGARTGFPHPYLVGQPTAIASIDSVRAAARHVAALSGAACPSARFVTVGGSQGGHAALWVDRLAPYYAPELTHEGVVATVPPADLVGEANRALTSLVDATGNMAAFYGVAPAWYGLGSRLAEVFVAPYDQNIPAALAASCDPGDAFNATSLDQLFQRPLLDAAASTGGIASLDPWGCVVAENGLTTTSVARITPSRPSYGILFITGEADALVHTPIERHSFQTLCTQGLPLQYLECAGASHTRATLWSLPEIMEFVGARFAGRPLDSAAACVLSAPVRCRGTPMM